MKTTHLQKTSLHKLTLAILLTSLAASQAATSTWNGAIDANWSTTGNWSPAAPNLGDSLLFDTSASGTTLNNDLAVDTYFNGLSFTPVAPAFTLGGNRIFLDGLVQNNATNQLQTFTLPIVLTNTTTFDTVSNDLNFVSANDITLAGLVSGPGALIKNGAGTLIISNKTYSGGSTVNAGTLDVANSGAYTMAGGALLLNYRSYYTTPTISFTADSSVGISLLDNTDPRGVDIASTIGTLPYKFTKIGEGIVRMVQGATINASSIDVAAGTLAALGGSALPQTGWGTTNVITVQNGATLRADDGGICPNPIVLNGGDGTSAGSYQHQGAIVGGNRNNGTPTNNIFTGSITMNADTTIGSIWGWLYLNGPISGTASLTKSGAQPLILGGTNTYTGNTTVSQGILRLGSSAALPGGGSILTLLGSSSLDLAGNNSSLSSLVDDGTGSASVDNSSATPATLTVTNMSFMGQFKSTGSGGLSIVSWGATTLLGANSHSGSNVVNSGTLEMNIPTGNSTGGLLGIADGTTLTLHKTSLGSSLKAAGAVIGTSGAANLNVDLGNFGNPSLPVINATNGAGVLAANGTLTVTFNNTANLVVGQFPIIRYTSRTGAGSFVLTPIGGGIVAQIVTNVPNKSIDLQITSAPITTWKGSTTNNLWNTTTVNWTYSGSPVLYTDGSSVLLDDSAVTNTVDLVASFAPSSILVNTTNTYTLTGAGGLVTGDLTKNGSGTLILNTANSYNNTVISGGTVQVGNNNTNGTLGAGTVSVASTLSFRRSDNITVGNTISGTGIVAQNNTNTLTLSVTNSHTGGTLVNQGVLRLGDPGALGVPASGIALATVASGAALDVNGRLPVATNFVVISGTGVAANRGALYTSAGQPCEIGCAKYGVRCLSLAGDASIGNDTGSFSIGNTLGNPAGNWLNGNGYSLTKIGNNTLVLSSVAGTAPSQFVITAGGVLQTGPNPIGGTIVISNNTWLDVFDNVNNAGFTLTNSLVIGAGGGQIRNTRGAYYLQAARNTYTGSLTLSGNLAIQNTTTYGGGPNNVATSGTLTFNGPISGAGGIFCTNRVDYTVGATRSSSTVTLNGASTYTGPTVVSLGYLYLSAAQQGGGTFTNSDNTTLDVPSQTGFSTVPMSTLALLGTVNGATLSLGRVTALNTNVAPITATNLVLTGTNSILLPGVAFSASGRFPLIKYTTISGDVTNLALGATGVRGYPAYLTNNTVNGSIDLVVPGGNPVYWTGSVNNGWDIATTANFKYLGSSTTYQQSGSLGDAVTFDDSSAITNVNLTTPLSPAVVVANPTNNAYVFAGTNITGSASLVKTGPGTLVLSNLNNNYTGGTFVGGGTLRAAFTPTNSLNNLNGTATVASGATLDMGSNNLTSLTVNISGSGVGGNGALQGNYTGNAAAIGPSAVNLLTNASIGGNNRWDIRAGLNRLSASNPNTTLAKVGSGYVGLVGTTVTTNIGDISILNGTLSVQTSTAGLGATNANIYIGNGGKLSFYQTTVPLVKNSIILSNGAAINTESGSGAQNIINSPINLVSGANASLNYGGGILNLAGPVNIPAGATLNNNGNFFQTVVYSNVISGAGSFNIQFQSYISFAASNTFTSAFTVPNCNAQNGNRGTRLTFIGNGSAMNASQIYLQGVVSGQAYAGWISMDTPGNGNTLTLGTNQQLRGDNAAYVRGSVVAPASSSLAVGQAGSTNYQYMIIGTNLTLQGGSTNHMAIYKTASLTTNSQLYVSNSLTLGGTLVIGTNGAIAPLVAGDSFKLYFAGSASGAFTNVSPAPGPGLVWDTSALASSGTLSVKAVSVSPTTTTIGYGNNATLTASTTLSAPINYQWYDFNTNLIANATNAALTLTKPAVAASGNYSCLISKGGAASTVVSSLTVTQALLAITATNISKNFGITYTFAGTEFVNTALAPGDSITSVSLTSSGAPSGAAAGTYPIVPSAAVGTGLVNYSISYVNGTLTVVQTVNLTPTNLVTTVTGNQLTLEWPADHIGWFLQSNSVSLVNTSAWFNVTGSDSTNKVIITLDPTQTNVFYRMKY